MNRKIMGLASLFGALAVILGAFGAHSLKGRLSNEDLAVFETGVRYQFYHVFALIAVGALWEKIPGRYLKWSFRCFIGGIILFSGSLYLLSCLRGEPGGNWRKLGAITPFGGLLLIAGWLLLFAGLAGKHQKE